MILQWKSRGPQEQVAVWQGKSLSLKWDSAVSRWHLTVAALPGGVLTVRGVDFPEGVLVRQWWRTPNAAKDAVDAALEGVIRHMQPPPMAVQRPLFVRVGHIGSVKLNMEVRHA